VSKQKKAGDQIFPELLVSFETQSVISLFDRENVFKHKNKSSDIQMIP
jgi:hypothetical protein